MPVAAALAHPAWSLGQVVAGVWSSCLQRASRERETEAHKGSRMCPRTTPELGVEISTWQVAGNSAPALSSPAAEPARAPALQLMGLRVSSSSPREEPEPRSRGADLHSRALLDLSSGL